MDHKPVLVSWNHADKLLQPVIKLRDFLKCRRGNNSTVVNSSHRSMSIATASPSRRWDQYCARVRTFSERPRNYWQQNPFFAVLFFGVRSLGDARSHARSHEAPALVL
jgi:hypothetical protein